MRSHNTKGVISIAYKNERFGKNVFMLICVWRRILSLELKLFYNISTVKDSETLECASIFYTSSSLFIRRRRWKKEPAIK